MTQILLALSSEVKWGELSSNMTYTALSKYKWRPEENGQR